MHKKQQLRKILEANSRSLTIANVGLYHFHSRQRFELPWRSEFTSLASIIRKFVDNFQKCLTNHATLTNDIGIEGGVHDLDNALHQLACNGSVKQITKIFSDEFFNEKKNKEWKIRYISRPGNNKDIALHHALRAGRVDNAAELLNQGADWYVFNEDKDSPYDVADADTITKLYKIIKKQRYVEAKAEKLKLKLD